MSDIIVKAVRDYCTAFGLNVNDVPRYFEEYLQIRLKRYTNLPAEQDASLTVNLFRKRTNELLDYYHKNRERLIFSTISDASIADND
jgi:hypothetical protein